MLLSNGADQIVYKLYDLTIQVIANMEDKMKRIFITLVFLLPILTLFTGEAHAQQEKFFDVVGEIAYGEECLKTWQIDEASAIVNKLLSTFLSIGYFTHNVKEFFLLCVYRTRR